MTPPETKGSRRDVGSSAGSTAAIGQTTYRGHRDPVTGSCQVTVDGEPLDRRYDIASASPDGFEWAYCGSGPFQLAVAILANAYSSEFATEHATRFKREVVAALPDEGWTLMKQDLDQWREEVMADA